MPLSMNAISITIVHFVIMSLWSFQCNRSGVELCFNGASCAATNSVQSCNCPPEFVHDVFFFHFPNCAMYVNSLLIYFVIVSALFVAISGFYLGFIFPKLRGGTRVVGYLGYGVIVSLEWFFASLYGQQGCYESCAVSKAFVVILSMVMVDQLVLLNLTPIYRTNRRSITTLTRFLHIWTLLCSLFIIAFTVSMLIYSRRDINRFNDAVFGILIVTWGASFIDLIAVTIAASSLANEIIKTETSSSDPSKHEKGPHQVKYKELETRLKLLIFASSSLAAPFLLNIIVLATVMAVLNSFPYFHIVYFILLIGIMSFLVCMFYMLTPRENSNENLVSRLSKAISSRLTPHSSLRANQPIVKNSDDAGQSIMDVSNNINNQTVTNEKKRAAKVQSS